MRRLIAVVGFLLLMTGCSDERRAVLYRSKIQDLPKFPEKKEYTITYRTHQDTVYFWPALGVAETNCDVLHQTWLENMTVTLYDSTGKFWWSCHGASAIRHQAGLCEIMHDCPEYYQNAITSQQVPYKTFNIIIKVDPLPEKSPGKTFALYAFEYRKKGIWEALLDGTWGQDDIVLVYNDNDQPTEPDKN